MSSSGVSTKKNHSRYCILKCAAELFSKLGFDKTSTRDISKQSEANISMISYHFGNKEGLYKSVIREFALEIKNNAEENILKANRPVVMTREYFEKEVEVIIEKMIHMRSKNPEISLILAREKLEGLPHSREIHEEIFYPLIREFLSVFKSGQDAGVVKSEINPALFFLIMSESIFSFFTLIECKTSLSTECEDLAHDPIELKKQILCILLNGVLNENKKQ